MKKSGLHYLFWADIRAVLRLLIIVGCSGRMFTCLFAYRKQQDKIYEVQHHGCEEFKFRKYVRLTII